MKFVKDKEEFALKKIAGYYIFIDIVILFLLWTVIAYFKMINSLFLPSPGAVFNSFKHLLIENELLKDVWISFYRAMSGSFSAILFAIPVGILLSLRRNVRDYIEPILSFIRFIPPAGFIPLSILWFGIGDLQKTLFIFIGIAPYLTLFVFDIAGNIKKELIEAAYILGVKTKKDLIFKIILPYSLPNIWDAMRILIGGSWSLAVLAEIVGAESGLGHLIITSQRFLQTDKIIVAILILGLLGFLIDYIFKLTYNLFFPWSKKHNYA